MQLIKLELSDDRMRATLSVAQASADCSARDIDRMIRELAAMRARMAPVHPAMVPEDADEVHHSDNLLWSVNADPHRAAVRFATHHPGLGWIAMWLSRAQVEDLQTSFEFELVKLPQAR